MSNEPPLRVAVALQVMDSMGPAEVVLLEDGRTPEEERAYMMALDVITNYMSGECSFEGDVGEDGGDCDSL